MTVSFVLPAARCGHSALDDPIGYDAETMLPRLLSAFILATAAATQVPADWIVYATRLPSTNPAAQILGGPSTAQPQPFGRFAVDQMPPTAIEVDPYDGHILLALEAGPTLTRVYRLIPQGLQLTAAIRIGDLPGPCRQLAVVDDTLLAIADGPSPALSGLWRLPRRGVNAQPTLLLARSDLGAMATFGPYGTVVVLAWSGSGPPGLNAGVGFFDVTNGQFVFGPFLFGAASAITGVVDLPTGLSRQLLAFADGTFALHVGGLGPPTPLPTLPPLPPAQAVALKADGGSSITPFGLGAAALPQLYTIDAFSGAVALQPPTLPGTPIDFALAQPSGAWVRSFAAACGPPATAIGTGPGQPTLGNAQFGFDLMSAASVTAAWFAIGASDFLTPLGLLPAPLPGGCRLHVEPLFAAIQPVAPAGTARQNVPIPPAPSLRGSLFFAQWLPVVTAGLAASPAIAFRID
ncbi:MAG: hypothetical protein IPK26_26855 [Planctomycetes bacterium]|nr:hypothetical protein [Planctomycetota bacterium]